MAVPFVSLMPSQTTDPRFRRQLPIAASTAPHQDPSVAVAVANLFERVRSEYEEEDVPSRFRQHLGALLETYGDPALEARGNVLKRRTTDPELVFSALQLLADEFGHMTGAVDVVSGALLATDVEIRYGAALALRQIGSARTLPRIEDALRRESSPLIKEQLAKTLASIQV